MLRELKKDTLNLSKILPLSNTRVSFTLKPTTYENDFGTISRQYLPNSIYGYPWTKTGYIQKPDDVGNNQVLVSVNYSNLNNILHTYESTIGDKFQILGHIYENQETIKTSMVYLQTPIYYQPSNDLSLTWSGNNVAFSYRRKKKETKKFLGEDVVRCWLLLFSQPISSNRFTIWKFI